VRDDFNFFQDNAMTITLGISCFYHDAAAALVRDGEIIAAAQEERFSRRKGDPSFPESAISYCLEEARIRVADIDSVVFYDRPGLTFDRMVNSFLSVAPGGFRSWREAMPRWMGEKFFTQEIITSGLHDSGIGVAAASRIGYTGKVLYTPHHLAHAAAAYLPSHFESAAILTVDGVGEWATASYGVGDGSRVSLSREMRFPHSLGLLYSAVTYFCGFKVNSGEYKLMGLAPYGTPRYLQAIKDHVAQIGEDGAVHLNMDYFGYLDGLTMISERFSSLFDGPPRAPETRITRREMDMAASIQAFTEEAVIAMARHVRKETGERNLCLAGGVALNCVANGKLYREKIFDEIWIQPAAGDAGSALGAALAVQYGHHKVARPASGKLDRQKGSYLGPGFSEQEVEAYLIAKGCKYKKLQPSERADKVAEALADGAVVGFFNGRMEFGPRSLGARSILGDPRREDTQRTMNLRIKYRESFRPFAPAVLAEDVGVYFDYSGVSPYMLMVAPVREDRCIERKEELDGDDLLTAVNQVRSDIPAVTHWDYSARIQTVHAETNPLFHQVISKFKEKTGISVVVNTSFNVRGEPVVCTPDDAYRCFMRTEMDYLYLEGFMLDKREQPKTEEDDSWKQEFELD
jgi:carbamoyltransferase